MLRGSEYCCRSSHLSIAHAISISCSGAASTAAALAPSWAASAHQSQWPGDGSPCETGARRGLRPGPGGGLRPGPGGGLRPGPARDPSVAGAVWRVIGAGGCWLRLSDDFLTLPPSLRLSDDSASPGQGLERGTPKTAVPPGTAGRPHRVPLSHSLSRPHRVPLSLSLSLSRPRVPHTLSPPQCATLSLSLSLSLALTERLSL